MTLADKVYACYLTRIPCIVWSGPGTGKTSSIKYLAKKLGVPIECIISSIKEPSDFSGLPVRQGDGVEMIPPKWAKHFEGTEGGILFFDELSTCSPNIQAALLTIVLDGVVGEFKLPETTYRCAASNFTDVVGNSELNTALGNRFIHLIQKPDVDQFCSMLRSSFDYKLATVVDNRKTGKYEENKQNFADEIAHFLEGADHRKFLCSKLPEEVKTPMDYAFCSPRSWTNVLEILSVLDGSEEELIHELIIGTIGEVAGDEFWTYIKSKLFRKFRFHSHLNDYKQVFDIKKLGLEQSECDVILQEAVGYCLKKIGSKNRFESDKARDIMIHFKKQFLDAGYAGVLGGYIKKIDSIINFDWNDSNKSQSSSNSQLDSMMDELFKLTKQ